MDSHAFAQGKGKMRLRAGSDAAIVDAAGRDRPAFAVGILVTALFFLGFQDTLIKLTSGEVSLWQFQAIRSSLNLSILILVSCIVWGLSWPRPKRVWAVALRSLLLVGAMIFLFAGIPVLTLAQIASGLYTFPLFVALLSFFLLGEQVGPRRIIAIVLGFVGTLLIMKPGTDDFTPLSLLPVAAGLCYAGTVIITRRLCRYESPVTLLLGVAICFVPISISGTLFFTPEPFPSLAASWPYLFTGWHPIELSLWAIIALCSVINVFSNMGLAKAYQSAEASWLAPFDYSYLVFATFWGFVFWGHMPDGMTFAGMALIAGAGGFTAWRERRVNRLGPVE